MRGRPFGFLGTLCIVWILSRIGFLSILPATTGEFAQLKHSARTPVASVDGSEAMTLAEPAIADCCAKPPPFLAAMHIANRPPAVTGPKLPVSPAFSCPLSEVAKPPPQLAVWLAPASPPPPSPFSLYAYHFHRGGSSTGGLDGREQYGGSQSGFVATYSLARNDGLALQVRGAIAHQRLSERELAAGFRLKPFQGLPVSITAERRFRNDRRDAFAIYLVGGKSSVALPLGFKAEGFAQAGVISDKRSGAFFDFAVRADRPLIATNKVPITAGAGVWGGGQRSVFRIDAGPTIATEIPLEETRLRISADWRFRIAGDARPASGPALTLSTSF